MKTINQSFSKKDRRQIVQRLRSAASDDPAYRSVYFSGVTKSYLARVVHSYGVTSFAGFLDLHQVDWRNSSDDVRNQYSADVLNRLADELEAVK
jgi:hypothetical protein